MHDSLFEQHLLAEQHHWWFLARRAILAEMIRHAVPADAGKRLVDIGCGTGTLAARLSASYDIAAYDFSEAAIDIARDKHPGVRFGVLRSPADIAGDLGAADLVTMFDVLEHIEDDVGYLRSVVDAMPAGGRLLLTVPAFMRLWGTQDEAVGHFRRYDAETLPAVWRDLPVTCNWLTFYNARLYPLVLVARTLSRTLGFSFGKQKLDYSVPPAPLNDLLRRIFEGELPALLDVADGRRTSAYSKGVSMIGLLTKDGTDD